MVKVDTDTRSREYWIGEQWGKEMTKGMPFGTLANMTSKRNRKSGKYQYKSTSTQSLEHIQCSVFSRFFGALRLLPAGERCPYVRAGQFDWPALEAEVISHHAFSGLATRHSIQTWNWMYLALVHHSFLVAFRQHKPGHLPWSQLWWTFSMFVPPRWDKLWSTLTVFILGTQVFIAVVLLLMWCQHLPEIKPRYEFLDLFAGCAQGYTSWILGLCITMLSNNIYGLRCAPNILIIWGFSSLRSSECPTQVIRGISQRQDRWNFLSWGKDNELSIFSWILVGWLNLKIDSQCWSIRYQFRRCQSKPNL